jgi:hypothetical protein
MSGRSGIVAGLRAFVLAGLSVGLSPPGALGQDEAGSDLGELAQALQNPVSDLISVPFQNNLDYDIGANERARNTLNIQPVLPMKLNDSWNVVTRVIAPIIYQPTVSATTGGTSGLGDINPSFFFTPASPGKVIWAVGPSFLLPTATQTAIGTGKWSMGPAAVLFASPRPFTLGVLANNLWSFAGSDSRTPVNQLLIQYFINLNLPEAWYLTSAPIITANAEASDGNEWLVPFGAGVGKVFLLGPVPLNGQVSGYWNAVVPDDPSPSWQLRLQLAFLFPKTKS